MPGVPCRGFRSQRRASSQGRSNSSWSGSTPSTYEVGAQRGRGPGPDFLGSAAGRVGGDPRSLAGRSSTSTCRPRSTPGRREPGRSVAVHGITMPPHYGGVTLQQLVTGEGIPPLRLSAPPLVDLPNGPGSTLACLLLAAAAGHGRARPLRRDGRGPGRARAAACASRSPGCRSTAAQAVHAELDELRSRLNVYRGHVLDVIARVRWAALSLDLRRRCRSTARDDVVLPEAVLARVERHALGVADAPRRAAGSRPAPQARAAAVRAARHRQDPHHPLPDRADDRLHPAGADRPGAARDRLGGGARARPAARGRSCSRTSTWSPRTAASGPAPARSCSTCSTPWTARPRDADLLFVLTTNRADLLEPALAARPGPGRRRRRDRPARRRGPRAGCSTLYGRDVPARSCPTPRSTTVVERTDGVTASFLKELLRRAVLESLARAHAR